MGGVQKKFYSSDPNDIEGNDEGLLNGLAALKEESEKEGVAKGFYVKKQRITEIEVNNKAKPPYVGTKDAGPMETPATIDIKNAISKTFPQHQVYDVSKILRDESLKRSGGIDIRAEDNAEPEQERSGSLIETVIKSERAKAIRPSIGGMFSTKSGGTQPSVQPGAQDRTAPSLSKNQSEE